MFQQVFGLFFPTSGFPVELEEEMKSEMFDVSREKRIPK